MSKLDFRLNREGVRTLMRSPEMKAVLKDRADTVKDRCGDGYDSYVCFREFLRCRIYGKNQEIF